MQLCSQICVSLAVKKIPTDKVIWKLSYIQKSRQNVLVETPVV